MPRGSVYDENDNESDIYLAIFDGTVASGKTIGEAMSNSFWKNVEEKSLEERLNEIVSYYPNPDEKLTIDELINIHEYLNPNKENYHRLLCERFCEDSQSNTIRGMVEYINSFILDDNMGKLMECYNV